MSAFFSGKKPNASRRTAKAISEHFAVLAQNPQIGRFFENHERLRKLIIPFGDSGYIALYEYDDQAGIVYILAFRHQKELAY